MREPPEVTLFDRTDLIGLPIHGATGRIVLVRRLLGLRQVDLAQELRRFGGRAGRETISHWENLDLEGRPRSRMSRRNAEALAALGREHGLPLTADLFVEGEETPIEVLARQVQGMAVLLKEILETLRQLQAGSKTKSVASVGVR